jgi:hypothetical protein
MPAKRKENPWFQLRRAKGGSSNIRGGTSSIRGGNFYYYGRDLQYQGRELLLLRERPPVSGEGTK